MFTRQTLLLGSMVFAILPASQGHAHHTKKLQKSVKLDPHHKPQTVRFSGDCPPGTILADPRNHFLCLVERRRPAGLQKGPRDIWHADFGDVMRPHAPASDCNEYSTGDT